jgi:hypothetical protein
LNRNRLLLLLLAVIVALPGCFIIAGFGWSRYNIPRGGKAIANFTVRPISGEGSRGYFFVLIHLLDENDGPRELKVGFPRKFDTKGKFNGPLQMVRDDDLEAVARDNMVCFFFFGEFASDSQNKNWFLLRTNRQVRSRGAIDKAARVKIGIEDRINDGPNVALTHFYTGFWRDTDSTDGPTEEDSTTCTSAVETTIPIGNGTIPTATADAGPPTAIDPKELLDQ